MSELKPCPFCGNHGRLKTMSFEDAGSLTLVSCQNCGGGNGIGNWNTRATDPRIAELEAELAALKEQLAGKWLPIESAPKDGTTIIVCQSQNSIIRTARWCVQYGHWAISSGPMGFISEVTHWMPRPPSPKEVCSNCGGTGMAYRIEDLDVVEGYKLADKKPCLKCAPKGPDA